MLKNTEEHGIELGIPIEIPIVQAIRETPPKVNRECYKYYFIRIIPIVLILFGIILIAVSTSETINISFEARPTLLCFGILLFIISFFVESFYLMIT